MSKMTQETEEKKCDGCGEYHPIEHLIKDDRFSYCDFCYGDLQEEKANWASNQSLTQEEDESMTLPKIP